MKLNRLEMKMQSEAGARHSNLLPKVKVAETKLAAIRKKTVPRSETDCDLFS